MVRIIKIEKRQSEDGREFNSLIIQGGVEMVQSKETGNFYATARKASITSTFDDETSQGLIGQEIPGKIEKAPCDPYEIINQDTGEVTILRHRYVYVSEENSGSSKEEKHMTISPQEVRFPSLAEA